MVLILADLVYVSMRGIFVTLVGLSEKIKGMKRREGRVLPSWKYAGALMGKRMLP